MKLTLDLSVTSCARRSRRDWDEAYRAGPAGPRASLVLDFAAGVYGATGMQGSFAGLVSFARSGARTVTGPEGRIETVAAGVPAMAHQVPGGERLGLSIEPARGNMAAYSEQFDNSYWSKTRIAVAPNTAPAPDGQTMADRLTRTSSTQTAYVIRSMGLLAGPVCTVSVFAKAGANGQLGLRAQGVYPNKGDAVFDLGNGTVRAVAGSGSNTNTTASITPLADGWYRCSVSTTFASPGISVSMLTGPTESYLAVGSWEAASAICDVLVWGAQCEAEPWASAYQPSGASASNRAADQVSVPLGGWWTPAAGTLIAETFGIRSAEAGARLIGGTADEAPVALALGGLQSLNGGVALLAAQGSIGDGGLHRVGFAWSAAGRSLAYDGQMAVSDGAPAWGIAPTALHLLQREGAGMAAGGGVRRLICYPERLSDAALAALT